MFEWMSWKGGDELMCDLEYVTSYSSNFSMCNYDTEIVSWLIPEVDF